MASHGDAALAEIAGSNVLDWLPEIAVTIECVPGTYTARLGSGDKALLALKGFLGVLAAAFSGGTAIVFDGQASKSTFAADFLTAHDTPGDRWLVCDHRGHLAIVVISEAGDDSRNFRVGWDDRRNVSQVAEGVARDGTGYVRFTFTDRSSIGLLMSSKNRSFVIESLQGRET